MLDKLESVERKYTELSSLLANPTVQADQAEYRKHAKALAEIEPLVERTANTRASSTRSHRLRSWLAAAIPNMRELAQEELSALTRAARPLLDELKMLLVPKDPNDEKNVLLEIRAGTGGDEAALVRRRPVPDVQPVRRASGMADRAHVD